MSDITTNVVFTLSIRTANAAFADGKHGAEIARILRCLAEDLDELGLEGHFILNDINGNGVGTAVLEAWEAEE